MHRLVLVATVVSGLYGCCCCGDPAPITDAGVRVLAADEPVIVKIDGTQQGSLSANTATVMRVSPGAHDVGIEVAGRPAVVTKINVKAGDDVFVGGHDTKCFAIVENPAAMGANPQWDVDKGPVPTTWSLVKSLKPGEVWPEGDDLTAASESPSSITVDLSDRLVAGVACDAPDMNAAITASMTAFVDKVSKF